MIDIIILKAQQLLFELEQSHSLSEDEMKILNSNDKMKAAISHINKQSQTIMNGDLWPTKKDLLNEFIKNGGKNDTKNKKMV